MNSAPTASGSVPQACDLLAAAGSAEILVLHLSIWSLLHTTLVPAHRWLKFPIVSSIRLTSAEEGRLF